MDVLLLFFFFFKQKTAYEMRISDWSSDVCSSDLGLAPAAFAQDLVKPATHFGLGERVALLQPGVDAIHCAGRRVLARQAPQEPSAPRWTLRERIDQHFRACGISRLLNHRRKQDRAASR